MTLARGQKPTGRATVTPAPGTSQIVARDLRRERCGRIAALDGFAIGVEDY